MFKNISAKKFFFVTRLRIPLYHAHLPQQPNLCSASARAPLSHAPRRMCPPPQALPPLLSYIGQPQSVRPRLSSSRARSGPSTSPFDPYPAPSPRTPCLESLTSHQYICSLNLKVHYLKCDNPPSLLKVRFLVISNIGVGQSGLDEMYKQSLNKRQSSTIVLFSTLNYKTRQQRFSIKNKIIVKSKKSKLFFIQKI